MVDEDGQPRPCASGVGELNADTSATLAKLDIAPTDPWGRPLGEQPATKAPEDKL